MVLSLAFSQWGCEEKRSRSPLIPTTVRLRSPTNRLLSGAPTNDELPEDGKFDATYPATYDLIATQSPVKSQGSRGVCSIFATVALMEHLYIKEARSPTRTFRAVLQWSVKKEVGAFTNTEGSSARDNLAAISRYGIVDEPPGRTELPVEQLPHSRCTGDEETRPVECFTNGDPPESAMSATRFKLPAGRFVNSNTRSIKAFITENKAGVIAGMTFSIILEPPRRHPADQLQLLERGVRHLPERKGQGGEPEETRRSRHRALGWDDNLEVPMRDGDGNVIKDADGNPQMEKGFFLFKNSWGTSGFGIRNKFGAGYGWLSYRYVQEYAACMARAPPISTSRRSATDGRDNDYDGAADCDDTDCADHPACRTAGLVFSNNTRRTSRTTTPRASIP